MEPTRRDLLLAAATLAPVLVANSGSSVFAADTPPETLRLVTFATSVDASPRVGVLRNPGGIVDLASAAKDLGRTTSFDPMSMLALIAAGPQALDEVREIADLTVKEVPPGSLRLLAPIPRPARNVYAVGWNYLEHFAEGQAAHKTNVKYPDHPVFFSKASHVINGPYDPIPFDAGVSTMIDWEGELAVIIGRRGRNIKEADALDHVFGWSIINDTTARDIQYSRGGQWFKGKSLDGHGPMGPCIVVKGTLDPENLSLTTRVNGVVKQEANTREMYFKVPKIIAELSEGLTLEPGDIIASGTPPGVGYARSPQEFLKPGDVMETEISGIGLIRNEIRAAV